MKGLPDVALALPGTLELFSSISLQAANFFHSYGELANPNRRVLSAEVNRRVQRIGHLDG